MPVSYTIYYAQNMFQTTFGRTGAGVGRHWRKDFGLYFYLSLIEFTEIALATRLVPSGNGIAGAVLIL